MASHSDAPLSASEAPPAHTDAYMDMSAHRAMWKAFGMFATWGSLLLMLVLGYAVFTITMNVPWLGAMIGLAVFGILAGMVMKLGNAWIATVAGLCVLGLIIEGFIALGSALFA
ncbi:MAG: aa3-type cytochrome c oxidase subunit IV [Hyphomonadaceae bacterium]